MARSPTIERLGKIVDAVRGAEISARSAEVPTDDALLAPSSHHLARLTGVASEIGVSCFVAYAYLSELPRLSPRAALGIAGDRDAVLYWYIYRYAQNIKPMRAPLSAGDIHYLLQQVDVPGATIKVPRLVLWKALQAFSGAESYLQKGRERELAYWWAIEQASALNVDACLIPNDYFLLLAGAQPETVPQLSFLEMLARAEGLYDDCSDGIKLSPGERLAAASILALERPAIARCLGFSVVLETLQIDSATLTDLLERCFVSRDEIQDAVRAVSTFAANAFGEGDSVRSLPCRAHQRTEVDDSGNLSAPALLEYRFDVEVVGPLSGTTGLSVAARASVQTLAAIGAKVKSIDVQLSGVPTMHAVAPEQIGAAASTIFHVNPDVLPTLFVGRQSEFSPRRAGYFFWELDAPASSDFLSLDLVDEIWTASSFVAGIYSPYFRGVVDCVGLFVPTPTIEAKESGRAQLLSSLNIPPDTFIVGAAFDGLSYLERKNPLGAVAAFQAAFPYDKCAALFLKGQRRPPSHGSRQSVLWSQIDKFRAQDPRVHLVEQTFNSTQAADLFGGTDVFMSLHRSEGFGLPVAEAMMRGVPAIVTAYGGTEDFCNDGATLRVHCDLLPVPRDAYPRVEPGRFWAEPEIAAAAGYLQLMRQDGAARHALGAAGKSAIEEHVSMGKVATAYRKSLDRLLARRER